MKTYLMFSDRNFPSEQTLCFGRETLIRDLGLGPVIDAMAREDGQIRTSCDEALFSPLSEAGEITYRQQILDDCLKNPSACRALYAVTQEIQEKQRESMFWLSSKYLAGNFSSAVGLLNIYTEGFRKLRAVADGNLPQARSPGLIRFYRMLQTELSDVYLAAIEGRLAELKDGSGVLISAVLGNWTQGTGYVFRRREKRHFRSRWFLAPSFSLAPRDDAGAKDLENRRNRAIGECTNALGQSAEHIGNFFALLGRELAFYVGCLNLSETLAARSLPFSLPGISEAPGNRSWEGLYDTGLALTKEGTIVGNTFSAKDTRLYIITGANQGGKTTFLRSIGQAQLMLQCGMIVGAKHFSGPIRCGLFTHFKKEEDTAMTSGKFEEELSRMHGIAERLSPGALVLFNESFSATNEREGSEICRQITEALIDSGIEVFSVTHLSPYAHSFSKRDGVQFLRAQRLASGDRTFRIVSGEPLPTAFGQDIWNKYMGKEEKLSEKGQAAEEKPPESQSFSLKEQT